MRFGATSSSVLERIGVLLFIFFCIFSFLNRSPYGEPSKAVAIAIEQADEKNSTDLMSKSSTQENWYPSEADKKPQKTWKKYVLDKVIVPLPLAFFAETSQLDYELQGVDRHSLSYRFSGLAPPFSA